MVPISSVYRSGYSIWLRQVKLLWCWLFEESGLRPSAIDTFSLYWAGKTSKEMSRDINELQKEETLKQNQKRCASPFFPSSQKSQLEIFSSPIFVSKSLVVILLWRNFNCNSITRVLLVYWKARVYALDHGGLSLLLLVRSIIHLCWLRVGEVHFWFVYY